MSSIPSLPLGTNDLILIGVLVILIVILFVLMNVAGRLSDIHRVLTEIKALDENHLE